MHTLLLVILYHVLVTIKVEFIFVIAVRQSVNCSHSVVQIGISILYFFKIVLTAPPSALLIHCSFMEIQSSYCTVRKQWLTSSRE